MKINKLISAILVFILLSLSTVFPTSATTIKMGDVNGDGNINIMDATLIQKKLTNTSTSEKYYGKYADFDYSGRVDIMDSTAIQKYLIGTFATYNYYLFTIDGNKATVFRYIGTASSTTIPSRLSAYGCDVTSINQKAFLNNSTLTTVTLPSTISSIKDSAFYNCSALTTVYSYNKKLTWGNSFVSCPKFQAIKFI